MTATLEIQIEALGHMTPTQLRRVYNEVFNEPSRSNNRQWLIRRVAWRMQAQAEGGLSERAKTRAAELARDEDMRLRPPTDRGPGLGAALRTVSGKVVSRSDQRVPVPGSVLVRPYRGKDHRVTVLPNGFEHDGTVYRSLSAVAHAITGSHWNGYHFFGLTRPRSGSRPTGAINSKGART
jgi:hypothetical protein